MFKISEKSPEVPTFELSIFSRAEERVVAIDAVIKRNGTAATVRIKNIGIPP
jgi:hypothetical protein